MLWVLPIIRSPLNLERASQASIDIATHIIKTRNLGLPNTSRELFDMLLEAKIIASDTCKQMQGMVGFRNIAVHDYQNLNLERRDKCVRMCVGWCL